MKHNLNSINEEIRTLLSKGLIRFRRNSFGDYLCTTRSKDGTIDFGISRLSQDDIHHYIPEKGRALAFIRAMKTRSNRFMRSPGEPMPFVGTSAISNIIDLINNFDDGFFYQSEHLQTLDRRTVIHNLMPHKKTQRRLEWQLTAQLPERQIASR